MAAGLSSSASGVAEVKRGWAKSYSPEAIANAVASVAHKPLGYRVNILISRLCFRGIYFPQMGRFAWAKTITENRRTIFALIREALQSRRARVQDPPSAYPEGRLSPN